MDERHPLDRLLQQGRARRPLVGAHRGASARAPENTLAAFQAALDDGADLVELDVRLTRDGGLAVIHDATTERATGVGRVVAETDMETLRHLDAGRHKGPAWAGQGVGIPELGDVFALLARRMLVNVEVKSGLTTLPVLARRIAACGMADRVVVSSFDPEVVRAVGTMEPRVLTGLLLDQAEPDPIAATQEVGAALLHIAHRFITPELVGRARERGVGVLVWTVNDPAEMRCLAALDVDAILSDDPRLLRQTLERD